MKQLRVKLTYDEVQAIDYLLGTACNSTFAASKNYADLAAFTLLIEFCLKKLKPHTYIRFDKQKGISIPIPVAYALVYYWQLSPMDESYERNVLQNIIFQIGPKLVC
jgi:hypothetical protein